MDIGITGDPILSSLLKIFGYEVSFLSDVKEEVKKMQIKLRLMQSFLEDADRLDVHVQSSVDRQRISEIREQSLDAEDVIDSYLLKLELRKRDGTFNKIKRYAFFIKELIDIHRIGSKIKVIKSKLEILETSLQTCGMSSDLRPGEASSSSGGQWQRQRQTFGHVENRNVVGLDGKIGEVVGLLLREQKPCRVVSIYGMGGLGKTTLAKKVYHNNTIRRSFDKFAWVCVSQPFSPRDIWEKIYKQLTSHSLEQIRGLADDELVSELYKVQKDYKCFILLDDIWSIEHWNLLSKDVFAATTEETVIGSKILLTTRIKELADHVDPRGSYGGLEPLNSYQSLELLQKIAFEGRDDTGDKESMEQLGKKMLVHCGGLPLAICVLAGILVTKYSLREWEIVHANIKTYLRKGQGHNEEQGLGVHEVLAYSYYDLPLPLKSCFLYLSQFPEDYEIQTNPLLKMWIAEGFVSMEYNGHEEEEMEDTAERYLNELVGRCMIQVGKEGSTGMIKTCRMHDLNLLKCQ